MKSSDYRQLKVWQKAMDLIPSNITEGQGRNSDKEFINFLSIARGSLWELETQLEICVRLGYIDSSLTLNVYSLTTEVSKMLNALANSLKSNV